MITIQIRKSNWTNLKTIQKKKKRKKLTNLEKKEAKLKLDNELKKKKKRSVNEIQKQFIALIKQYDFLTSNNAVSMPANVEIQLKKKKLNLFKI